MFEEVKYPSELKPEELDIYLAKGWYRMGQSIFTTSYVFFEDKIYPAIWLRHVLKNYEETKTIINLKKRNKAFRVELKQVQLSESHEELFEKYKSSIHFNAAENLFTLLYGYVYKPTNIYNTYEINIYDGAKLIACSYFDIGEKSAEGISAFYDPEYRNHSLGKYLIYLQIEICKHNNFTYFYPGYFVPGYPHLDYKLAIGTKHIEFFDPEDMLWYPISEFEDRGLSMDGLQDFFIE
jgi:arginine-tRNA-protein transferase